MATLHPGARRLPAQHISIRVPWHDDGWKGTVCTTPRANTSCLVLKNIGGKRDDALEEEYAGRPFSDLPTHLLPPCLGERATFMSPHEIVRTARHPYAESSKQTHGHFLPTPYRHAPRSAACIPFRWMMKPEVEGTKEVPEGLAERHGIGYDSRLEPELPFASIWVQERRNQLALLDTFFGAVQPQESLCFFYAKRTPLSERSERVIVGVGRVTAVGKPVEYERSGKAGLRCVLWERNVCHSITPEMTDGFLFPYADLLAAAEKDPGLNLEEMVAFAPREYFGEFSYAAEHVPHDGAIASLLECTRAIGKLKAVLPGPWDEVIRWIDAELNRLWKMRGPFPGFGSALKAWGMAKANLIAHDLGTAQERAGANWSEDPWALFELALHDPALLGEDVRGELGPTWAKHWKALKPERKALLKLLSRFAISEGQAARYFQPSERLEAGIEVEDSQLLENPYLLFELDRRQPNRIEFDVVDRGLFPDPVVREKYPVPAPSRPDGDLDPRRVRAILADTLESAASEGHTLLPEFWAIQRVRDREVRPACALGPDILQSSADFLDGVVRVVLLSGGKSALQLDRYDRTKDLISLEISKRRKGKRHAAGHPWRKLVDEAIGKAGRGADEEKARLEKAEALEELYSSRISVLVGPAGTGKTTLLKALCRIPEVSNGGILLLAPTGKARVRLEQQAKIGAKTIAQFLAALKRYDGRTGEYLVTRSPLTSSDHRTVIIDESSMLTEEQLAATLDALTGVERLVLVGDTRQLPPIGAGRPFVDIVRKLAPENVETVFPRRAPGYAELTVLRRQEGERTPDILLAGWFAGTRLESSADELWDRIEHEKSRHLRLVEWATPEDLQERLIEAVVEELRLAGPDDEKGFELSIGGSEFNGAVYFHPHREDRPGAAASAEAWQVLSPVRAGLHGVDPVNRLLHEQFRKSAKGRAREREFWKRKTPPPVGPQEILYGDKVINLVNDGKRSHFPRNGNPPYIANGDIGIVVGKYRPKDGKWVPKDLEVEFVSHPGVKVDFRAYEFSDDKSSPLELAYALTIHKAQGSEFGTTFVVLPNPCRLLSRELLYTALTRQRSRLVLFHQGPLRDLRKWGGGDYSDVAARMTNLFEDPRPVEVETGKQRRFLEEGLIHRTRRGDLVRSKSEVILANLLYDCGVRDYQYERELVGKDGSRRYPDFTLDDAASGIRIYWEHLGLLTDPGYRKRWDEKKAWYKKQGILPHEKGGGPEGTLVWTEDDPNGGIDCSRIEKLIREVLK